MTQLICENCGVAFNVKPSVAKAGCRFCSNPCRAEGMRVPASERWQDKYEHDRATGCWNWTGKINAYGYGVISLSRREIGERIRSRVAHRVVYETVVGPIPEGLDLDHLCRNRRCVRPDHLEPVTRKENLRRGSSEHSGGKTHCKYGHEFTPENTIIHKHTGYRACRTCRNRWQRDYNARKRFAGC
jgi:hypothetical protein